MAKKVMIVVAHNVDKQRIDDLLAGHSGSMSPWLSEVAGSTKSKAWHVTYDSNVTDRPVSRSFTQDEILAGLATFACITPAHFADWLCENDDDNTFDTAWQAIIFGKMVYN